tara:strand:+ start:3383 stop:3712 length:330 start_codon:yes stop_codon:yes gene_type:complete
MSHFNEEEQIKCYGCTQEEIDNWVKKTIDKDYVGNNEKAHELGMMCMSILSDVQHEHNEKIKNQWINKTKYILSKWMMRDSLYLDDILPCEREGRYYDAKRQRTPWVNK